MAQDIEKIDSTDEAWESGLLGSTLAHTKPAPIDMEAMIDAYKLIGAHHSIGYQQLVSPCHSYCTHLPTALFWGLGLGVALEFWNFGDL